MTISHDIISAFSREPTLEFWSQADLLGFDDPKQQGASSKKAVIHTPKLRGLGYHIAAKW
jgi:hypothetical protein